MNSTWIPKGGRFSAFRWKPLTRVSNESPIDIPECISRISTSVHRLAELLRCRSPRSG